MIVKPKKSKFLLLIIAVLLLANITSLFIFFNNRKCRHEAKPPVDRKEIMTKYLTEELKFDPVQMKTFDSLSAQHKLATDPLFETLREEKEKRLRFLTDNNYSDSALLQAVNRSAEKQKNLDLKMLEHIRNVRSICTDNQKNIFDTGFYKMMKKYRPERKPATQPNK